MAARINKPNHDEKTKRLIQASQLLNRLNLFANGEIELTQAQVNAAKIVIGKSIPDMRSIELTGDPEKPIEHNVNMRPQLTKEEWLAAHGVGTSVGPTE